MEESAVINNIENHILGDSTVDQDIPSDIVAIKPSNRYDNRRSQNRSNLYSQDSFNPPKTVDLEYTLPYLPIMKPQHENVMEHENVTGDKTQERVEEKIMIETKDSELEPTPIFELPIDPLVTEEVDTKKYNNNHAVSGRDSDPIEVVNPIKIELSPPVVNNDDITGSTRPDARFEDDIPVLPEIEDDFFDKDLYR